MHALAGLPEFGRLNAIVEARHRKALVAFRPRTGESEKCERVCSSCFQRSFDV